MTPIQQVAINYIDNRGTVERRSAYKDDVLLLIVKLDNVLIEGGDTHMSLAIGKTSFTRGMGMSLDFTFPEQNDGSPDDEFGIFYNYGSEADMEACFTSNCQFLITALSDHK